MAKFNVSVGISGWKNDEYETQKIEAIGASKEEALQNLRAACEAAIRELTYTEVEVDGIKLPETEAGQVPTTPEGMRLLVVHVRSHRSGNVYSWTYHAVTRRSFKIYHDGGEVAAEYGSGSKSVELVYDDNIGNYALPKGNRIWVNGEWTDYTL